MAFVKHDGNLNVDDVVVDDFEGESSRTAYKILKVTYVPEIEENLYIVQSGTVRDNDFKIHDNASVYLLRRRHVTGTGGYTRRFVPGPSCKKGDILHGSDREGNLVVLLFESKGRLHRLTPLTTDVSTLTGTGHGSLAFYEGELTGLTNVKISGFGSETFSTLY